MNRITAAIIILTSSFLTTQAQITQGEQIMINQMIPQPVPKSPHVAGIEKFGDYPVSYFTGLPEISIPIFQIKSGELEVPITLSYHASGVKPTDLASWVGLQWTLSAGGQISRNVQGKPDEQYFYTSSLVQNPTLCGPSGNYYYIKNSAQAVTDTQPDVFSYSFPGGGGKFLLNQSNNPPTLIPYAPHVVIPTFSTNQFTKFEITNEHGVLHRFGTSSTGTVSQEYTFATNGGNPSLTATTAWHLMDMIAPNSNDQISFSYQDLGTINQSDVAYSITVQDQCAATISQDGGISCPFPYLSPPTAAPTNSAVNQQGLSMITFKTGKVEFVLLPRSDGGGQQLQLLDHINIYSLVNGSYSLIKTVSFVYSYYTLGGTYPNFANGGGLKLDQVQFKDNTNKVIEQYRFTYATNSFSWNGSNPNFANARDLWGYYNGALQNTDLIPTTTIPFQQVSNGTPGTLTIGGAADRTVHTQYSLEGVLSRIDFPTGGYTVFNYENNKYDNNGTPTIAGGLRVAQILSYDGSGAPPKTKTYKYGNGESGVGVANFSRYQYNYQSNQYVYVTAGAPCDAHSSFMTYNSRTFYSSSAFSYTSYPVMYPYVTEYFGDPATNTIGKVVYEFDNGQPSGDVDVFMPHSGKPFRDSFEWRRGKLTHKTVYDSSNNKLSETVITNNVYNPTDNIIGLSAYQYEAGLQPVCTTNAVPSCLNEAGEPILEDDFTFINITQSTGVFREVGRTEYTYQNGNVSNFQMKQTANVFDLSKFQLAQTTVNRSDNNQQEVTINRYPFQLSASGASTGNAQGVYMLNQKNIVSSPFETYSYLQNSDGTNARVISGHLTTYRQNASNTNYVVPDQIYFWESSSAQGLTGYTPSFLNAGNSGLILDPNYKQRINLVSYDNYGNAQQVSETNNVQTSYKYGYNNSLPSAEVKNAQNTLFYTTTPSTGVLSVSIGGPLPGTILRTYSFNVDYTGTVYLKLGVTGNPSYSTVASYSGISSGSITLGIGTCGQTVISFPNVTPGAYSLTVQLTTPNNGVSSLGACGEIDYPQNVITTNPTGITEFLYEGFEENNSPGVVPSTTVAAHTGGRSYKASANNGSPYTVSFTMPNSRTYLIEYWYLDGAGTWQHVLKPYSGTSMTLSDGSAIDDVRIYPADARMKSYTYDPVLGITSIIEESGLTHIYEYDSFGRLARIRNYKGDVEKAYMYNYKGN